MRRASAMEDFEARYELGGELARGGLAIIRDAWDRVLHRKVAVKQLLERSAESDERFLREARITGRLVHPNIVPIYDLGVDREGAPFYAMKWVTGRSLHELIEARPALDDRLALVPHVIAIIDAIAYAHAEGVVHRDLKPANVLVGDYGETIVIDWGLALEAGAEPERPPPGDFDEAATTMRGPRRDPRLTSDGSVIGTPAYMPPEQAVGDPVDARADVYALGALLYHVIAGAHPYADELGEAASFDPIWARVIDHAPKPLAELAVEAPYELIAIVERAMARDPAERYPSAAALGAALAGFVTHQQSHRLAATAARRDVDLARRMATVAPTDAAAAAGVYREADVVRFGFEQALAAWPDNPFARSGLARYCARMFDFEVAAGNLAGAAALASELPPDAERARLLDELSASLARRDADVARLEHARDRSVGGRERLIVMLVLAGMLTYFLVEAFTAEHSLVDAAASRRVFWNAVVVSAPVLALMALWRRRLFANEFSQRSARVVLIVLGATICHRGLAIAMTQPAQLTFTLDLLLIAVALASFGGRGGYLLAAAAVGGAWACATSPNVAVVVYNSMLIGFAGFLAWSWTRKDPAGAATATRRGA